MKICQNCQAEFPILVDIDGVKKNLGSRKFCLTCSPFGENNRSNLKKPRPGTIDKMTPEDFKKVVKESNSRKKLMEKLGLCISGASYKILSKRIKREEIDISHFRADKKYSLAFTLEQILKQDFSYSSKRLRIRLVKAGLIKDECSFCGIGPNWNGKPLTLQLDHINGSRDDNRLENLRIVCPNCHTQTPTYGNKKRMSH